MGSELTLTRREKMKHGELPDFQEVFSSVHADHPVGDRIIVFKPFGVCACCWLQCSIEMLDLAVILLEAQLKLRANFSKLYCSS